MNTTSSLEFDLFRAEGRNINLNAEQEICSR
jgi:hypothetical protein